MNHTPDPTITDDQSAAIYGGSIAPPTSENEPDIEAMLARAEQRGYLRGRNEAAREMMCRPAMWQPVATPRP